MPYADIHGILPRLHAGARVALFFAIGFGLPFAFPFVGKVPVPEIFLAPVALILLFRVWRTREWPHPLMGSRTARLLWIALGLSFAAYVVTDLVRGTPPDDFLRGWARWVFLAIDLFALGYLIATYYRLLGWLAFGYAAGVGLSALLVDDFGALNWKFHVAYPLSYLLPFLLAGRKRWLVSLALLGVGLLHLTLGTRSLGAVCLATGLLLWTPSVRGVLRFLAFGAGAVAATFLIAFAYSEVQLRRGEVVNSDNERSAMLEFAASQFAHAPLIGNGSWFTKTSRLDEFFAMRAHREGLPDYVSPFGEEEVSVHSQLLISLAEGGVFGGVFFATFACILVSAIYRAATLDFPARAFVILFLLNSLWDVFMTPFSGSERLYIAIAASLAAMVHAIARAEGRR